MVMEGGGGGGVSIVSIGGSSAGGRGRTFSAWSEGGTGSYADTDGGDTVAGTQTLNVARATEDADAVEDERSLTCDFFDTRPGFLRMCQGNHYQFDSLRRAKHSSMMILWHLQHPSIPAYAHTCNVCESDIGAGTRWVCLHADCPDFDCCETCVRNIHVPPHPHPLTPNTEHLKLMLR